MKKPAKFVFVVVNTHGYEDWNITAVKSTLRKAIHYHNKTHDKKWNTPVSKGDLSRFKKDVWGPNIFKLPIE